MRGAPGVDPAFLASAEAAAYDELMFDNARAARSRGPGMCAQRHLLDPGTVLVGWRPCHCPGARHGGHTTWTCLTCAADPDVPTGEEVLLDGRHTPEKTPARLWP